MEETWLVLQTCGHRTRHQTPQVGPTLGEDFLQGGIRRRGQHHAGRRRRIQLQKSHEASFWPFWTMAPEGRRKEFVPRNWNHTPTDSLHFLTKRLFEDWLNSLKKIKGKNCTSNLNLRGHRSLAHSERPGNYNSHKGIAGGFGINLYFTCPCHSLGKGALTKTRTALPGNTCPKGLR